MTSEPQVDAGNTRLSATSQDMLKAFRRILLKTDHYGIRVDLDETRVDVLKGRLDDIERIAHAAINSARKGL